MVTSGQTELFSQAPEVAQPTPGPRTLTLVDASGFIFRAYHALPPLTTSRGVPTHAVLGFTRMLLKLLRERRPEYVALCFDLDSRRGRLAIDPAYKANRAATPEDLLSQFELIRKVAAALALPILEVAGWEADDVIATMVSKARAWGFNVEVVSSDKDLLQLLAADVSVFDPVKEKPITEADALAKFGVGPAQLRDYQALVGDAVDNVPRVPGVGPKTAAELLRQFGSVDALLERLGEVARPKLRAALEDNRAQLERARALVTMRTDLPLEVSAASLARRDIHQAEARALFTELEFFRLVHEMPAPPPTPLASKAELVADAAGLSRIAGALAKGDRVALAPAFDGAPHSAVLRGLGVAAGEACFFIDVDALAPGALSQALGPALRREGLEVAAHGAKALLHALRRAGVDGVRPGTDVELLSYLANPSRREHALADLTRERLQAELPEAPLAHGGTLDDVPVAGRVGFYAAAADAIGRLGPQLWAEAEALGLGPLARELELPLVPVLARMEAAGVQLDLQALARVGREVDAAAERLLAEVYALAGHEFNVASPPQLARVLFDQLGLPVVKKGKTGPSTDHEVLEKLAESHPLPRSIIEYRNVARLKSGYLDTLPQLVGADGRIRTTFQQAAVATGRLSSINPNLQNIPVRSELGRQIREAFVAGEGQVLVSADYSQIELRILAHISGDEALIEAFASGADVHARTAAEVFGLAPEAVTAEHRRTAKMVNYGIAYGLSAHGLSARLNIPVGEAKGIIERYFERFPGIARYVEETVAKAKRAGFVESLFGRRRYMPELASRNRAVAMAAERAAINMPIQGTAADLMKRAMLRVDAELPAGAPGARVLLQVHDELLFEAPEARAPAVGELARRLMGGVASLRVPLVVDVGVGRTWASAH